MSTKAFQREWRGFAPKIPGPCPCGIDDDASLDFATRRSDSARDRSVEDQRFAGTVSDDLKAGALGLRQQIAQQGVAIDDSIGWTENRVVKLKPGQKREALPPFGSRQGRDSDSFAVRSSGPSNSQIFSKFHETNRVLPSPSLQVNAIAVMRWHSLGTQLGNSRLGSTGSAGADGEATPALFGCLPLHSRSVGL